MIVKINTSVPTGHIYYSQRNYVWNKSNKSLNFSPIGTYEIKSPTASFRVQILQTARASR